MTQLLQASDPAPAEIINPEGDFPILLVCEHAGQGIPTVLGDLGLSRQHLDAHIGWDIGAAAVTRHLSASLNATAVLQYYSRLVIDCNRPPDAQDSMPQMSDGIVIPANLKPRNKAQRIKEIFTPYQAKISHFLDCGRFQAVVSIHSFTPVMRGIPRPWDIAFLYRKDKDTSLQLARFIETHYPGITIGYNEPYQASETSDWFVPVHGEARGIAHSLIEIRNDHIGDTGGQKKWANILAPSLCYLLREKL